MHPRRPQAADPAGMLSHLPTVAYAGRVGCITGYGAAARHQVHALQKHGLGLRIKETGSDGDPDPNRETPWIHATRRDSSVSAARASIIHVGPNCAAEWRSQLPHPQVLVSVWETTRLPAEWVPLINAFDQAWCATQWQADVYVASGVDPSKVRHVPFALDPDSYSTEGQRLPEVEELRRAGYFVIGSMFQWTERKDPVGLIGAYMAAFHAGERVVLVLKAYEGHDARTTVMQRVQAIIDSYQMPRDQPAPRVIVISRKFTHEETLAFYRSIDVYISAHRGEGFCVLPGSPVTVRGGIKPIEEVSAGDEVLSSDGQFHRVSEAPRRPYAGPICRITARTLPHPIAVTPDHEVLVVRGVGVRADEFDEEAREWTRAGDIRPGDYVCAPRPNAEDDLPEYLDMAAFLPAGRFLFDGQHVWSRMGFSPRDTSTSYATLCPRLGTTKKIMERAVRHIRLGTTPKEGSETERIYRELLAIEYVPATPVKLRRYIPVDAALLRFLGLYVADGCVECGNKITIYLNDTSKRDLVDEMAAYCTATFGADPTVTEPQIGSHKMSVRLCGTALAAFMENLCGRGAHNKRIPEFLMDAPLSLGPVLAGYFRGDGCSATTSNVSATTVSPMLAWQIRHVLAAVGFMPAVQWNRRDAIYALTVGGAQLADFVDFVGVGDRALAIQAASSTPRRSRCYRAAPGGYWVRVKKIEIVEYSGEVYDLRVDDVHDFECGGVIVHNCLPIAEALLLGRPVIATDWSAPAEYAAGCYFPIPFTLEAPHSMGWQPFYTVDQRWAAPDRGAMARALRRAHAGGIECPRALVQDRFRALLTRAGEGAKSALEELLR